MQLKCLVLDELKVIAANEVCNCSSNKHTHKLPVEAIEVNFGIHIHHLKLETDIVDVIAKRELQFFRVNGLFTSGTFAKQIIDTLNSMKVLKRTR